MQGLVAGGGRSYCSQTLTTGEHRAVANAISRFHKAGFAFEFKQCFFNAQMLARFGRGGGLVYVEGYRLDEHLPRPILHGRVTINDKVIDPTAAVPHDHQDEKEPARVLGVFLACAYWGIPFDPKYVASHSGGGGKDLISLIDDWQGGYPLLRDGLPVPTGRAGRGR
jgi:hypothetical protein